MVVEILESIGDKIVAVILATTALASGLFASLQTTIAPGEELASVYNTVAPPTEESTGIAPIVTPRIPMTATITPGLLPTVVLLPPPPPKKTTATKAKTAPNPKPEIPAQVPVAATPTIAIATPTIAVAPPTVAAATPPITAQWLADNTKISFQQKRDGTYEIAFAANSDGYNLTWGAKDPFIGGDAAIPKFAFSFSCNPLFEMPPPDSPGQTPFFKVRTPYDCTTGFAATQGDDQKMRSKNLHFETGPGQLAVTPPVSMNALLKDGTNNGGFVFANHDTKPVTVTRITLDLAYTALNTQNGPLVLRVLDPLSGASLSDYHMEKLAADPAASHTYAAAAVEMPVRFTLKPMSQKLLPIQVLGVQRMNISGVDPRVAITLRALAIDVSDMALALNASQIHWSCVVPLGGYSPNATSGPFATGEACR